MYSRITAAKDGRDAIRYAEGKGPGQNGRNILITTINMLPNGKYAKQMAPLWKKARSNHKVQARRIIISFSKKELDPDSEEDVEIAYTIVKEFVKTYYPDRQAAIFFQNDGKGGCLHCHVVVNDVSITDHKGCTRTQQFYKYVRNGIDSVASKYIGLDDGDKLKSKQTHTERAKAEKAAKVMEEHPGLQGEELRKALIEKKAYSYKEDMKQLIHEAALKSCDLVSFFKELKARGIETIKKISPKYGEHFVYDYTMCPISVKNTKARSYKLGYSYSPEGIQMLWDEQKNHSRQIKNKPKSSSDFSSWMQQQGLTCFSYDKDGKLQTDFDLMDEMHTKYLDTTAIKELSDRAQSIKRKRKSRNKKTEKHVQLANEQLADIKKDKRQYEYSL